MSWLSIIAIAFGSAMDGLAVAIGSGLSLPKVTLRHVLRLAFHFGLFQTLLPVLGYVLGRTIVTYIGSAQNWVAFGLLVFIGGKMLWQSRRASQRPNKGDPTKGWALVSLSVATSLDGLAVGLSLAMLNVSIWVPALVFGLVTAVLAGVGIALGGRAGSWLGRLADAIGGTVLIAVGVKVLVSSF
jgi:putative Mn2+ efflux pump MntP